MKPTGAAFPHQCRCAHTLLIAAAFLPLCALQVARTAADFSGGYNLETLGALADGRDVVRGVESGAASSFLSRTDLVVQWSPAARPPTAPVFYFLQGEA